MMVRLFGSVRPLGLRDVFDGLQLLVTISDDILVSRGLFKIKDLPLTLHDTRSNFTISSLGFQRVKLSPKDDNPILRIWQFAA